MTDLSPLPRSDARRPSAARRAVVGIVGNQGLLNESYPAHTSGTINSEAVAQVAGCLPLIIPTDPRLVTVAELLD
ncbi:MAG TPA: gamma-glutamyl-gamma-aminobutyrate hydrolase family protein, partial [Paracoccaceae bacterium]|nr:gamma-glutamyl-gamma-aminobutyrate hydrolase family protein [Paracoccaceae bacterium]